MIQRLTRSRGIRLNRRAVYLKRQVKPGEIVSARISAPETPTIAPAEMPLSVLYEDADVLLVDKPAGLLVHPTSPRHTRTLAHGVAAYLAATGVETRVRPVHRLDRDTSGLVLFAKTAHAHQQLDRQLRDGEMIREYLLIVQGGPVSEEGTIRGGIAADPVRPDRRIVSPAGVDAATHYRVVQRLGSASLIQARLETGRTHQIRVHFAHIGTPVLGDRAYGGAPFATLRRPALHSWRLTFRPPSTDRSRVETATPPEDLEAALRALRNGG